MRPIRVLIVDDDPLVRAGLVMMLGGTDQVEVAGEASDGSEVLSAVDHHRPDVVLLDLGLPELSGYRSFRAIQIASARDLPIVIFTADESILSKELTLGFGASDYLVKQECSPARLRHSLRMAVLQGRPPFDESTHN